MNSEVLNLTIHGGRPWGFSITSGNDVDAHLKVSKVRLDSKAGQLGLREGDRILLINGVEVKDRETAVQCAQRGGDLLQLKVARPVAGVHAFRMMKHSTSDNDMGFITKMNPNYSTLGAYQDAHHVYNTSDSALHSRSDHRKTRSSEDANLSTPTRQSNLTFASSFMNSVKPTSDGATRTQAAPPLPPKLTPGRQRTLDSGISLFSRTPSSSEDIYEAMPSHPAASFASQHYNSRSGDSSKNISRNSSYSSSSRTSGLLSGDMLYPQNDSTGLMYASNSDPEPQAPLYPPRKQSVVASQASNDSLLDMIRNWPSSLNSGERSPSWSDTTSSTSTIVNANNQDLYSVPYTVSPRTPTTSSLRNSLQQSVSTPSSNSQYGNRLFDFNPRSSLVMDSNNSALRRPSLLSNVSDNQQSTSLSNSYTEGQFRASYVRPRSFTSGPAVSPPSNGASQYSQSQSKYAGLPYNRSNSGPAQDAVSPKNNGMAHSESFSSSTQPPYNDYFQQLKQRIVWPTTEQGSGNMPASSRKPPRPTPSLSEAQRAEGRVIPVSHVDRRYDPTLQKPVEVISRGRFPLKKERSSSVSSSERSNSQDRGTTFQNTTSDAPIYMNPMFQSMPSWSRAPNQASRPLPVPPSHPNETPPALPPRNRNKRTLTAAPTSRSNPNLLSTTHHDATPVTPPCAVNNDLYNSSVARNNYAEQLRQKQAAFVLSNRANHSSPLSPVHRHIKKVHLPHPHSPPCSEHSGSPPPLPPRPLPKVAMATSKSCPTVYSLGRDDLQSASSSSSSSSSTSQDDASQYEAQSSTNTEDHASPTLELKESIVRDPEIVEDRKEVHDPVIKPSTTEVPPQNQPTPIEPNDKYHPDSYVNFRPKFREGYGGVYRRTRSNGSTSSPSSQSAEPSPVAIKSFSDMDVPPSTTIENTTEPALPVINNQSKSYIHTNQSESLKHIDQLESPVSINQSEHPIPINQSDSSIPTNESESPIFTNQSESPILTNQSESPIPSNQSESPIPTNQSESPVYTDQLEPPISTIQSELPINKSESPDHAPVPVSSSNTSQSSSPVNYELAPEFPTASTSASSSHETQATPPPSSTIANGYTPSSASLDFSVIDAGSIDISSIVMSKRDKSQKEVALDLKASQMAKQLSDRQMRFAIIQPNQTFEEHLAEALSQTELEQARKVSAESRRLSLLPENESNDKTEVEELEIKEKLLTYVKERLACKHLDLTSAKNELQEVDNVGDEIHDLLKVCNSGPSASFVSKFDRLRANLSSVLKLISQLARRIATLDDKVERLRLADDQGDSEENNSEVEKLIDYRDKLFVQMEEARKLRSSVFLSQSSLVESLRDIFTPEKHDLFIRFVSDASINLIRIQILEAGIKDDEDIIKTLQDSMIT